MTVLAGVAAAALPSVGRFRGARSAWGIGRVLARSMVCVAVWTSLAAVPCAAGAASVPRFSWPVELDVGADPFRMVAADLNGDGKADVATVDWSSATVSVLLGRGNGEFRKRTAYRSVRHPAGIAVGDLDGDGDPDLISASVDRAGSIAVFRNRGSGRFRRAGAYASAARAYAVAAADINQDGTIDLVTANDSRHHLTVLEGQGAGRFRLAHRYRGARATDVALGDLNDDGNLDAALAASNAGSVVVRLGQGDGSFGPARAYRSGSYTFGVALFDANRDGTLDLAAANYGGGRVAVFLGTGDGTFSVSSRYPMGAWDSASNVDAVLVADFDRDANLDIATPGEAAPTVRRGAGDGTLLPQQDIFECCFLRTVAGAVADFNGDGWPDLAFSSDCDRIELPGCRTHSAYAMLNWTADPAPPCVVSDLTGRPLRARESSGVRGAARELRLSGCRLGKVGYRDSRKIRKGHVITQRPYDGAVLRSRSRVDVVVSRGRRR
jgi:hypothetical protein